MDTYDNLSYIQNTDTFFYIIICIFNSIRNFRELLFKKTGIEKKGSFNVQDYVKEQTKSNCPACSTA